MKLSLLRAKEITSGSEIFRIASLFLYVTLLLHVMLLAYAHHLRLPPASVAAIGMLALLFFSALVRHADAARPMRDRRWVLGELLVCVLVIAALTIQRSIPTQPLPWLVGAAGVFPLALHGRVALLAVAAIAAVGFALNARLATPLGEWLPQILATLFVGVLATLLSVALRRNQAAIDKARRNERRFDAIARATRHIFLITDAGYRVKYVNPAVQDVLGYTPQEFLGSALRLPVHPDDRAEHEEKLRQLRDTPGGSMFSRHRKRHKNGQWIWLETSGFNMLHDNAIEGLVFSIEDVSARKDAELRLADEHALLRAVLDLNPSMIYAKDRAGRFTISNRAMQRRFGYASEEELRGKTSHDVFLAHSAAAQQEDAYAMADRLHRQDLEVMRSGEPLEDVELQGHWESDRRSWYRVSKYPLHDAGGNTIGLLGIAHDVTDRKEYELQLEHLALHDPLTGLPNRRYLIKRLAAAMAEARSALAPLAVLFCDLDFFKSVNVTHGHDFGDQCLTELTHRITATLPEQDFVARFGGNEFVVLTRSGLKEANERADALLETVSRQLVVDGVTVKIQTSVGIALLNEAHKTPSDLIRDADAAMHQAKERGRNRAEIFDASLQGHTKRRAQMDVALRFALERDELAVVYQPKVSVADGSIKGFELLLRWNSTQYGHISPIDFIPIAETSGLVVPIGMWVFEEACKQLGEWQSRYQGIRGAKIAVNVSMRQLLQTSFLPEVRRILDSTGVVPSSLELELTETSAMANPVQTVEMLVKLKKLGLRLALDDFGTGYSSLAYLQKLPIDVLKIDRAFVQGLGSNPGDIEIIRLILTLAQTLNLETVAEGVETATHVAELRRLGCQLAQGYAFSPPVPAEEAERLLRTSHRFIVGDPPVTETPAPD
ncbi:MAG TPA: EAL domain-containing protein [Paucimonas sp.]|nr:EAL domain-containing protein [Paucimonas sp.]